MNKLIEFNVPGGTVVVEGQDGAGSSPMRGGAFSQVTEKVGKTLEDTLGVIRPVADAALATCNALAVLPAQMEVEFSLRFDAQIGAVIARTSTEGSLRIKLVWKPA